MAESYSLEAILSARDTNFTSTMDNAQKAMGGLGKSASGIGASIGKIATGFGLFKVVSGTISALSSGFRSLTGELNESSIAWQTFESNMAMLGKSSGEIDSTRKSLEKFAQQTIYSASDMAQTYGQMAAIGVEDTERLVKAMGGLAASAENPQQAMKTLSQQMTQAMAKPTLSWADFKLMLEQTPAGMSEVAKEMGYALDDFVVAVQDGEIASKDFAKAVSEVGTNEHFGAMATEFKSVGQAMDGARETIANKLMPAFEMLSAIGIKAISGLTDWIDTLDFSGILGPLQSLASMFGIASDEVDAMTETVRLSAQEIQAVADGWNNMTLTEKQATVQTMGQEDLSELLEMLGVDFESIPDEYTKDAFLNTYGKDALEEILWVTGQWHDLTLDEKRAVLEAQIDNKELKQAIEDMNLWENTEFYSKFADINMNDNDSGQQILELINYYRELDGQEPIELEVDVKTKQAQRDIKGIQKNLKQFTKSLGPIGKMFEELSEAQITYWGDLADVAKDGAKGMVDVAKSVFKGDWKGAWDIFKDTSMSVLEGTGEAMWKITESQFKAVGNMMKNTDWSQVFATIGSAMQGALDYIGDIGSALFTWLNDKLANVKWNELGQTVGRWIGEAFQTALDDVKNFDYTKITKMFDDLAVTIDTLGIGLRKAAAGALEGLIAGMGYEKELEDLKTFINDLGSIEFDGDFTALANQVKEAFKNAFGDWDLNDFLPKVQWQWGDYLSELDWTTGEWHEVDIETGARVKITEAKIEEMDFANLINEATKLGMIEQDIDGNFKINPNYTINDENPNIDESALNAKLKELLGEPEVSMEVQVSPQGKISSSGVGKVGGMIADEIKGQAPSEVTTNTNIKPETTLSEETSGGGIGEKITSFIQSFAPKTVSAQVDVEPITDGGTGSIEAPKIDFSGMIADAQSAMQTVNQTITSGMTNVASAVRIGTVMMNTAFRSGMNQAVVTAQNTANRVLSAFNNLSSNLYSAGVMAGAGFRNGLASQQASIISTAQSIANSVSSTIQSALRIASPSKVTTYLGEMVGAGLIAGMDGMVSGVESSANRLSLATLPTTDLGSSRYSGSISGQSTSSKLDEVIDAINRGQVIMMDSGALVGETSRQMDVALGQRGSLGGRHKL